MAIKFDKISYLKLHNYGDILSLIYQYSGLYFIDFLTFNYSYKIKMNHISHDMDIRLFLFLENFDKIYIYYWFMGFFKY